MSAPQLTPRLHRLLRALLGGPVSREAVDRITGASNGPDEVMQLRRFGLEAPCSRRRGPDRDGRRVATGVYSLIETDRVLAELLASEVRA